MAYLPGRLLVIWDGLPAHRSRLVQQWVAGQRARLELERLLAYAPELNPVEYLWGYWKRMNCPISVPRILPSLATKPVVHCAAWVGVPLSSAPSGNKPSCSNHVSILRNSQIGAGGKPMAVVAQTFELPGAMSNE